MTQLVTAPMRAAIVSGVLLALSFPRYGHPAVGFIALVPLLLALSGWSGRGAIAGVSPSRGFLLGLVTGFIHYAGTVYWTGATVSQFGGLPKVVGVLVAGLLALYMAAYIAVFGAISAVLIRRLSWRGLWLTPAVLVSMELVRSTYVLGGFPWIPLGNTMVTLLPIAQLASVFGVFGLSWFVATLNVGFLIAAIDAGPRRIMAAATSLGLILAVSVWGGFRMSSNTLISGPAISVGLIQGNIAQNDKWNPARAGMILERYLDMSRQAVDKGARLLIWPESSTPFYFEEDISGNAVRGMVRQLGVPLLLGSDEIDAGPPERSYNSAFMLDVGGATAAVYRKIHLVPFGEYVPMQRLLFFVGPLVEAVSSFSFGERVTMLPVDGHMVSTAICYEVTYPQLAREAVREGSELLTTITNDAWYGESSAPFQHFEMAIMRAIEQGRYLVRSANTGISGIVDPYGRVLVRTNLFETVAVVGEARFVTAKTVYATIGDVAAYLCVAATVLGLCLAWFQTKL